MSSHTTSLDNLNISHDVDIDALHQHSNQLEALTAMLSYYHDATMNGGGILPDRIISSFHWQMEVTIKALQGTIQEAADNPVVTHENPVVQAKAPSR
jgi:hypothetical protein